MYTQNLKCLGDDREPMPFLKMHGMIWKDVPNKCTRKYHYLKFKYDYLFSYSKHIERLVALTNSDQVLYIKYEDFSRITKKR